MNLSILQPPNRSIRNLDLSIIIVNWNACNLLAQCLESVYVHPPDNEFEVLVVDNASSDGSTRMVRDRFPWVRLIKNSENVGFARANNQAIQESAGRYVLLLNPDTVVHPGALDKLVRFMDDHPKVGAAGARLLNEDGSVQLYPTVSPTLSNQLALLLPLPWHHRRWHTLINASKPCEIDRVKGAALVIRWAVIEQVGGLDEEFFLYAEEDDLCLRLRQAGWKIFYLPDAAITHYGGASTELADDQIILLYRSKIALLRKHEGKLPARTFKVLLWTSYLVRWLLCSLSDIIKQTPHPKRQTYTRLLRDLHRF